MTEAPPALPVHRVEKMTCEVNQSDDQYGAVVRQMQKAIRAGEVIGRERRRAGQRETTGRNNLENFSGANRFLHLANHGTVLIDQYGAVVRQMQKAIRAGEIFQVVPSRRFSLPCPSPLAAYDFSGANRFLHLANHGTVLIVALINLTGHFLDTMYRQRRRRFGHLLLQLLNTLLKAFFLCRGWRG